MSISGVRSCYVEKTPSMLIGRKVWGFKKTVEEARDVLALLQGSIVVQPSAASKCFRIISIGKNRDLNVDNLDSLLSAVSRSARSASSILHPVDMGSRLVKKTLDQ